MPLKGIPPIISPDLLKALAEMGHGDTLVLADAHFPSASIARDGKKAVEIRYDGVGIPTLLEAILALMPLDQYDAPYHLMAVLDVDRDRLGECPEICRRYHEIIRKHSPMSEYCERYSFSRHNFYEEAKKAFLVIHTGEMAQYGNIILRKGVVMPGASG